MHVYQVNVWYLGLCCKWIYKCTYIFRHTTILRNGHLIYYEYLFTGINVRSQGSKDATRVSFQPLYSNSFGCNKDYGLVDKFIEECNGYSVKIISIRAVDFMVSCLHFGYRC